MQLREEMEGDENYVSGLINVQPYVDIIMYHTIFGGKVDFGVSEFVYAGGLVGTVHYGSYNKKI